MRGLGETAAVVCWELVFGLAWSFGRGREGHGIVGVVMLGDLRLVTTVWKRSL